MASLQLHIYVDTNTKEIHFDIGGDRLIIDKFLTDTSGRMIKTLSKDDMKQFASFIVVPILKN